MSVAFKSDIFASAISSNCFLDTFPTFSEFGVGLPLERPAAFFKRTLAGVVFTMKSKLLSSYTVMTTGTGRFFFQFVGFRIKCVTKVH